MPNCSVLLIRHHRGRHTVAAGVGKVNFWCTIKYFRRGMTKHTPKKAEEKIRATSLPKSSRGSDNRLRRYIAGMALTARIPNPPAAVAALQKNLFVSPNRYIGSITFVRYNSPLGQSNLRKGDQGAPIQEALLRWVSGWRILKWPIRFALHG